PTATGSLGDVPEVVSEKIPDIVAGRWKPAPSDATRARSTRTVVTARWGTVAHLEVGGGHGQPVHEGLEVHDGAVLVEGRRVRRPEGADPAGHRGCPAAAPGAVPAGCSGDRQPAAAGNEAEPPARRDREAAGLRP